MWKAGSTWLFLGQVLKSRSYVKVHGHGRYVVAKVVGATSSDSFLVYRAQGRHVVDVLTLAVFDGLSPAESVVQAAVHCRRRRRQVPQTDRDAHELDVALGVVPDQQLDARAQFAARLVVDLPVRLDRHEVLFQRVAGAVDVRHPVTARASTVNEVTQPLVFKYLHRPAANAHVL